MGVELLDVETTTAVMHVNSVGNWAFNLNRLGSVALLRVQLTTVTNAGDRVNEHHRVFGMVGAVWSVDNCLPGWVEAEVRLVHKLFIE